MKKRMVVLLLVMIMISGLCVNAMATERGTTHYLTNVKYYRLSHQYILSGNYYYCKCCGYKNPTMVVSGVTK